MKLRLSSEADVDYAESLLYYLTEGSSPLADRFSNQLEDAYRSIREAPFRNRMTSLGLREKHLTDFPFSVLYTIEGDEIFVQAIYHDDRKRSKVKRRM